MKTDAWKTNWRSLGACENGKLLNEISGCAPTRKANKPKSNQWVAIGCVPRCSTASEGVG